MNIVLLERKSVGMDVDVSAIEKYGTVTIYDTTTAEQMPARVTDADIILVNKVPVNAETIGQAKHLRLVCVTATGTNNLDKEYLDSHGIAWRNVAGYSTEAVAQHTFAMLLYLLEHLPYYDNYVKSGAYTNSGIFTHFDKFFPEICGKTWGILGLGAIGRRVAEIATCFGAKVIYYSTSGKNHTSDYKEVDFHTLLQESDILSVHAPLTEQTLHLFNADAFHKMKSTAVFLNVGRGPIVQEEDLALALENGEIAAAGLDVLDIEPMKADNPLARLSSCENLLITPHIAWATTEARQRLMQMVIDQVAEFVSK